ncbi:hypothetical protein NMSP_0422 [Candidatus Nitrosomarinus catalina]|uniref:Uncharacterized protein n=2 Tax=Candidatus Nitrosomarinus catalinensis TaxID=1898749 RepID=A0A2Z2HJN8_9ARCH|nr:hypothetical protein NMSP_0422 [Candidatus Nitrosomarinus catalina]
MLEKQNIGNLRSETLHFPNISSLMKISLGLILFTMISTVMVYAQTSDNTVTIVDDAYLEDNTQYIDNTLFSSSPGSTITVINNDVVSHMLVSGSANSNRNSNINYDDFLVCEFDPNDDQSVSNQDDNNACDFNKDNRIITEIIPPGASASFTLNELGTYRIIDPDYPWIEFVIYSFQNSDSSDNVNSGYQVEENTSEPTMSSESTPVTSPSLETLSVTVDGMPFDVNFSTVGLNVYEIESDTDSMSLIFYVDVRDSNGKLEVIFDREFFDSVYDGVDDQFFILSDGDETIFREIQNTSESRTLSIDVQLGTEELEIIGSEFGFSKVISVPVIETPVIETPVIETPVIETPVIEIVPTNECGPGTILENDVCVLDERCGPGTILENDVCVLDSSSIDNSPTVSNTSSPSSNKEMIISFSVAFGIAGVIGIILALIAKAHKKK